MDTNLGNMRGKIYKKNSIELKDYASKKSSRKKLEKQELELELGVSSPKKPQTAIGSRNTFTSKSRNRPMTFGMNSLYN